MTTLTIDAGAATSLQMTIESGEVNTAGIAGSQITLSYGYFAGQEEVLQDRSMDPELQADGTSTIVLLQTPGQADRARQANAHLRLQLGMPAQMSLAQSRMESATLFVKEIHGMDLAMKSGTLDAADNSGPYSLTVTSGTIRVANPAANFHHQITVQAGTIVLAAGVLLPLVTAEVEQGVIQGGQGGQLEQLGVSGWQLTPLHPDPRSLGGVPGGFWKYCDPPGIDGWRWLSEVENMADDAAGSRKVHRPSSRRSATVWQIALAHAMDCRSPAWPERLH